MNMQETAKAGFAYLIEVVDRDTGRVRESEVVKNLMPLEGINHLINVSMKGSTQITAWYLGLYEGNYTPTSTDTMAAFPAAATETTAYDEATRRTFTPGAVAAGTVDNSAAKAEFTINVTAGTTKTIYGGFIGSASAKGSTSGVLLSAVKFASPKTLGDGDVLRVTAGFTIASA